MGFLSQGDTLTWDKAQKVADYIREHGIEQFLNLLHNFKDRNNDPFLWGDEVPFSSPVPPFCHPCYFVCLFSTLVYGGCILYRNDSLPHFSD